MEERRAYLYIFPTVLLLIIIIGYPVVQAFIRSLYSDSISNKPSFIGLSNYIDVLTGADSKKFWEAAGNTVFFTVVTVVLETLIGFLMATVMNRAFRGRALVRASVLVPWAIPTAVVAVLWRWVFDARGIINAILGHQVLWLGSEWPAKTAIIFADVWKTSPFLGLLILAGLQGISHDLYEQASVDGANAWQKFVHITLPLIKPALVVAILFRMMDALRMYDLPQIFTGGANNTETLSMLVVRQATGNLNAGLGSALSTLTFVMIFAIAVGFIKLAGAQLLPDDEDIQSPRKTRKTKRAQDNGGKES
jgi:multiple sugar transport system permease protein